MIDAEVTVNGVFFLEKITSDMISTNPIIFTAPPNGFTYVFHLQHRLRYRLHFLQRLHQYQTFEPTLSPSSSPTLSPTQQQTIEDSASRRFKRVITLCEVELYDDELNSITISGGTQSSTGDSKGSRISTGWKQEYKFVYDGTSDPCISSRLNRKPISQGPILACKFHYQGSTTNHTTTNIQ